MSGALYEFARLIQPGDAWAPGKPSRLILKLLSELRCKECRSDDHLA